MYTAKHAMMYKHLVPDGQAYVFYIDIRAAGKGYEEFIKRATEEYGIIYIRGRVAKIYEENGKLIVQGVDTLTGEKLEVPVDMVVLAMGMVPSEDSKKLAQILRIPTDVWGFYQEVHPKLRPVESASSGIFVCGAGQGPKDISESVAQASAAAAKAISLLSQQQIYHEPIVAFVNPDKCCGCKTCETICPYGAIRVVNNVAEVNEILCEGCGSCVAACPSGAVQLRNYRDDQIISMIQTILS